MRHILCRQVLLQNGDGGGKMQRGEGLQGEKRIFYVKSVGGRSMKKATRYRVAFPFISG
jgi:heterodisulfide reductase subunit A-like polyferredoxin